MYILLRNIIIGIIIYIIAIKFIMQKGFIIDRSQIVVTFAAPAIIILVFAITFWILAMPGDEKPISQRVKKFFIWPCYAITAFVAISIIAVAAMIVNEEKICLVQNYLVMKIVKENMMPDMEYICNGETTIKSKQDLAYEYNLYFEKFWKQTSWTFINLSFIGAMIYLILYIIKRQTKKKAVNYKSRRAEIIPDKTEPIKPAEPKKPKNARLSQEEKTEIEKIRKMLKEVKDLGDKTPTEADK
jgi:hypothetical protein